MLSFMSHAKCLFLTLIVFVSSNVALSKSLQCQEVNWYDQKEPIDKFNGIIDVVQDSAFVRDMLKNMDPLNIKDKHITTMEKRILGYNYEMNLNLSSLSIKGISGARIDRFKVTSARHIQMGGNFNSTLSVDVVLNIKLKQLTQPGCKDDEEKFLGFCYKKCSILTNGSHNTRGGPNICLNGWKPWVSGVGCRGFAINAQGDCPTPYYRMCLLDGVSVSKESCPSKTIQVHGGIGLKLPKFQANTMIRMMCKGLYKDGIFQCQDLDANKLITALIQKKFKQYIKELKQRMVGLSFDSLSLKYDEMTALYLKLITKNGSSNLPSAVLSFLTKLSHKLLRKDGKIQSFLLNQIQKMSKNILNGLIESKVQPSFGKSCPSN